MSHRKESMNPPELMLKASGKNQQPRLCWHLFLSVLFCLLLVYFQLLVTGSCIIDEFIKLEHKPSPSKTQPSKEHRPMPKNYLFKRALKTIDNKSDPCAGRYIYVHDLPPQFNEDMLKECKSLSIWTNMCKFTTNAGLGPTMENVEGVFSNTGWYATNQFAVDVIFSNRMKQYECLTRDSSIAAAIFVPFYAGLDISRYLWGYNTSARDASSLALVNWLVERPEWKVMGGKDHFLVGGRITWDFRRLTDQDSDWGSKLLFLPAVKNMSMLVVEASPWNANDFAIPYPTYFHPEKDADVFVWQERMRKLERQWLFSFAGAPRPGNAKSIRGQLIEQCRNSKVCKLLECDMGQSKCHSPSNIMQMFQSSLFCLQPQGDSYTRRSAFDSMLAGCIPVFFHPGSAYTQYTWHLPRNYSKYSVFISEDDIRKSKVSIEERLLQISPEQVKMMREEVISLIPRLIYGDPRSRLETLKDAFDVAVQAVIDKVTKLRKDIIEGREDPNFFEEITWKYALLEEGQSKVGPHEWDSLFSKPKDNGNSDSSSAEAPKNSWKHEQRGRSEAKAVQENRKTKQKQDAVTEDISRHKQLPLWLLASLMERKFVNLSDRSAAAVCLVAFGCAATVTVYVSSSISLAYSWMNYEEWSL
ncbi:xyloglucan galactosyltransferase KATAMARI1 homolog [Macadamia integrifolia]|uniref:xyloglucan galactosyltransferase KATAMARI1 homolog n=1 Tax=Macadamia integrifolia TaxID=60698 RepID=UPI001C4E793A|nr:xyloglucan galactosyltransferase KATAMARI1 homolog [Macadamia integrifolia]